ncbi:pectate lyase [Cellulomonas soli]|uniref:pectate lyase n=1 Tax=Cellulomonas soli TaxID=931535 RepID=UPI003F835C21
MHSPTRRGLRAAVAATLITALTALGGLAAATSATAATPSVDSTATYQLTSWRSKKALDTDSTSAGTALIQSTASSTDTGQQFQLVAVTGGYYQLVSKSSGLAVSIGSAATATATLQKSSSTATTQQFSLAAGSSGRIKLVNRGTGKALTVKDASKADGALITQATDTNATEQQFTLTKVTGSTTTPTAAPTATPTTAPTTAPAGTFPAWPTATGEKKVTATIKVTGTFDGKLLRYYGISDGSQDESQPPMFQLADGATIKNVILGEGAGDGIHCLGTCTIENVWWENVGEDAATQKGKITGQVMTVNGGGARSASDKVFQHNGPGTMVIKNFQASDIGKLVRSCGNCSTQYARTIKVENVQITAPAKSLVGINPNLGDKATLTGVTIIGDPSKKVAICQEFKGVTSGEPTLVRSGPSAACGYTASAVLYK